MSTRLLSSEYARRVLARLCVKCEAGLQEDDAKHCVECAETCGGLRGRRTPQRPKKLRRRDDIGYTPLDELETRPAFRILQTLRHFDAIQAPDLFVAIGIADHERPKYRAALSVLRTAGRIECDRWRQYSLNDDGRAALREQLDRAVAA